MQIFPVRYGCPQRRGGSGHDAGLFRRAWPLEHVVLNEPLPAADAGYLLADAAEVDFVAELARSCREVKHTDGPLDVEGLAFRAPGATRHSMPDRPASEFPARPHCWNAADSIWEKFIKPMPT